MMIVAKNKGITSIRILIFLGLISIVFFSCSESTIEGEIFGSLAGTVVSESTGDPLSEVKITTSPASTTVFTDENGNFTIGTLLVDTYAVEAEFSGFTTAFESAEILEGETSEVAFELTIPVGTNEPPSVPELLFPESGSENIDIQVVLAWDSIDPEDEDLTYTIDLFNGTTNEEELFTQVNDTTLTVSDLSLSTTYFWQVTVSDEVNQEVSSQVSSFTTTDSPLNTFTFVKEVNGNNVIFSGSEGDEVNENIFQLTSSSSNSFRPSKDPNINRIAFLRTIGGNTQIFTMDPAGQDIRQVTQTVPVVGFKQEEVRYTWAENGSKLYYPNFDKLWSINPDGSGLVEIYRTTDGSIISEVAVSDFENNIILLKTSNFEGYDVRIFTYDLNTQAEVAVVQEGIRGAAGGINLDANAENVLFFKDNSGSQNSENRIIEGRVYIYNLASGSLVPVISMTPTGVNDLDPRFSPSQGSIIFKRVASNTGAISSVYRQDVDGDTNDQVELFDNGAKMPDWQ